MTNVSMDHITAAKFDLTESFGWRDPHLNRVLASVQRAIGFELRSRSSERARRNSYRHRGAAALPAEVG